MKTLIFLLCFFLVANSHAELYKWVNEEGETLYSDKPPHEDATPLDPPGLTTTPAVKYQPKTKPAAEDKSKQTAYKSFRIISPAANEIINDNTGNITVTLDISPKLDSKEGHTVSLFLDNQSKIEGSTGTSLVLKNIDRGTHTISAIIKNKQGKSLKKSNTVTVHLKRFSKLHK